MQNENQNDTASREAPRFARSRGHQAGLTFAAALFAGIALPGAASAQEDDAATTPAERRQAFLDRFDADGDGRIDEGERQAARDSFRSEVSSRVDTNGDGKIDESERAAAQEAARSKVVDRYDTDGDGQLTPSERAAARKERADLNNDGSLSRRELDRAENRWDRKENRWDRRHDGGPRDSIEDRRDRFENRRDRGNRNPRGRFRR